MEEQLKLIVEQGEDYSVTLFGDGVQVGDVSGEVARITLRSTQLRTVDGKLFFVPNGDTKRSTFPSESHVKSTRVARRDGCSLRRCTGMIGNTCPMAQ